jgi:hypothetical protein
VWFPTLWSNLLLPNVNGQVLRGRGSQSTIAIEKLEPSPPLLQQRPLGKRSHVCSEIWAAAHFLGTATASVIVLEFSYRVDSATSCREPREAIILAADLGQPRPRRAGPRLVQY